MRARKSFVPADSGIGVRVALLSCVRNHQTRHAHAPARRRSASSIARRSRAMLATAARGYLRAQGKRLELASVGLWRADTVRPISVGVL